jgi:tetratricopeptide (TPR) repeat protein
MEALQHALDLYTKGQYEEALETLLPVLESEPVSQPVIEALLIVANTYDELGDYARALEMLQRILVAEPEHAMAWNNIGVICQKMERFDEAKEAYERAYRSDPTSANHLINLAVLHLRNSDVGTAKDYLDLALKLDPSSSIGHANMALVLGVFGRLEEAEESLRVAVLYGFNNPEPIQERINKMKQVRQSIVDKENAANELQPGEVTPDEREARDRMISKEKELLELVKHRHESLHDSGMETEDRELLEGAIITLRMEVRELRKTFDLPEVTEDDMFMGENYMVTPEELPDSGDIE